MDTLDYDHSIFDANQQEADKALLVRFYKEPMRNDEKSEAAGRLICDDVDHIEIRVRGQKDNIVKRPVRKDDQQRFRAAWRAYQDNTSEAMSGTPLSQWPALSAGQVEELKFLGFATVEQLVTASDGVMVGPLGIIKNKAKAYIELSKGNAPLEKMSKDLAERDNVIATMQAQMAQMQAKIAELTPKPDTPAPAPKRA